MYYNCWTPMSINAQFVLHQFLISIIPLIHWTLYGCKKSPPPVRSTSKTAMRLTLVLCLSAVSLAAPTKFLDSAYDWSDELAEFYGKISQYISTAKHNIRASTCDASKIALPSYASGLTSSSGLKPIYVALGRGTQVCSLSINYQTPGQL